MGRFQIGGIYRTARPYSAKEPTIDGLPNFFYLTSSVGKMALLESGINWIARVEAPDALRLPAILISSSPHKTGSEQTPWHDTFDPDRGAIRYYGDNKTGSRLAELPKGNALLLSQFSFHTSPERDVRLQAAPLLFFRRVMVDERTKGNVMFQGFGVVTSVSLVTQVHPKTHRAFANYVFDFAVFSMAAEGEDFDWEWINRRRDSTVSAEATLKHAPKSWRDWVKGGSTVLESCRRRVQTFREVREIDQIPRAASAEDRALRSIYEFYRRRKHRFENLASLVAATIATNAGGDYKEGWISPPSADGGWDFIGRIDFGVGVIGAKIVCLGQAKCEDPGRPTSGNSIARLVARLQRGWIGFYVTTSFFSVPVQREVQLDKYPVVLVHGKAVADTVLMLMNKGGHASLDEFLSIVDARHERMVKRREPSEVLLD
jgi:hypothetical protein